MKNTVFMDNRCCQSYYLSHALQFTTYRLRYGDSGSFMIQDDKCGAFTLQSNGLIINGMDAGIKGRASDKGHSFHSECEV